MSPLAATIPTAATGSRSTPLVHAFIRTLLLGNNPAGYISLCRAIGEAATPDYKGIAAPVLILAGEEDKTAPLEGVADIMGAYGSEKKEVRILQGVGHWHVLEAWEEVQGFIGGFLGEI
jgi:pimeloyl-ACP methyl ester carboxylesterase